LCGLPINTSKAQNPQGGTPFLSVSVGVLGCWWAQPSRGVLSGCTGGGECVHHEGVRVGEVTGYPNRPLGGIFQGMFDIFVKPKVKGLYNIELTDYVDPFVLKYSMDGQRIMKPHVDDLSDITLWVPLNNSKFYGGARMIFPGLDFDSREVPVGWCLMFEGKKKFHIVEELTSGTRYTLIWWTSIDEVNYDESDRVILPAKEPIGEITQGP